jgi:addiction module RelE/StbE family toxin
MIYKIKTTKPAKQDMRKAAKYIIDELFNPVAASRLIDEAVKAINGLKEMPKRHPIVDDDYLASLEVRLVPVQNYLVFYTVNEETKTVMVRRFLYGKRDWRSLLQGEEK